MRMHSLHFCFICSFQLRFASGFIHRYLTIFSYEICFPFTTISMWSWLFLFVKLMSIHLCSFNFIHHFLIQIISRSSMAPLQLHPNVIPLLTKQTNSKTFGPHVHKWRLCIYISHCSSAQELFLFAWCSSWWQENVPPSRRQSSHVVMFLLLHTYVVSSCSLKVSSHSVRVELSFKCLDVMASTCSRVRLENLFLVFPELC